MSSHQSIQDIHEIPVSDTSISKSSSANSLNFQVLENKKSNDKLSQNKLRKRSSRLAKEAKIYQNLKQSSKSKQKKQNPQSQEIKSHEDKSHCQSLNQCNSMKQYTINGVQQFDESLPSQSQNGKRKFEKRLYLQRSKDGLLPCLRAQLQLAKAITYYQKNDYAKAKYYQQKQQHYQQEQQPKNMNNSNREEEMAIKMQILEEKRKRYFFIASQRKKAQFLQQQLKKKRKYSQNIRRIKSVSREKILQEQKCEQKIESQKFVEFMKKCGQYCFKCQEGNAAAQICSYNICKNSAFICGKKQCKKCKENHKSCPLKLQIQIFSQILNRNIQRQRDIERQIFQFQELILEKIESNRVMTMKYLAFQGVNSKKMFEKIKGKTSLIKQKSKLRSIYLISPSTENSGQIALKGSQVIECFSQFEKQSKFDKQRLSFVKNRLAQFKKNMLEMCDNSNKMLLEQFNISLQNTLTSRLVNKKSSLNFILKNLDFPEQLKLLYRASQNEFNLTKYHQLCDNIQHTLTIIKTEFGKLVGAYTPLRMNDRVGFDKSKQTFLMAIDVQERMELTRRGDCAVFYRDDFGPCFGGLFAQRDIEVYSQDNNLFCKTYFPSAFNWKNHFLSNQDSWYFLTGVSEGNICRVIDFEVFRVKFRK